MNWASSQHPSSTRQSRRERAIVLTRDPVCYLRYDGCTTSATEDDHVIPLSQGGSSDLTNRRGACHHCHTIKTQREAAAGRRRRRHLRAAECHPGVTGGG